MYVTFMGSADRVKIRVGDLAPAGKIDTMIFESLGELSLIINTESGIRWIDKVIKPNWRKFIQPHQKRVIDEADNLSTMQQNLGSFISTNPEFEKLSTAEKVLMTDQNEVMIRYLTILEKRIDLFKY